MATGTIDIGSSDEASRSSSTILRTHYDAIYNSISSPLQVAMKLYSEKVITDDVFERVEETASIRQQKLILLGAVKSLVHQNHVALKRFASILFLFGCSRSTAKKILLEYRQCYSESTPCAQSPPDSPTYEEFPKSMQRGSSSFDSFSFEVPADTVSEGCAPKIHLKSPYQKDFNWIRSQFCLMSMTVVKELSTNPKLQVDELKLLIVNCFPELQPATDDLFEVQELLLLLKKHCTVLDVTYLEAVIDHYEISEMKQPVESYRRSLEAFCDNVTIKVCCGVESFGFISPAGEQLICDTVEFVLEWEPADHMLSDVKLLLEKAFGKMAKKVKVLSFKDHHSVLIDCYAHHSIHSMLIVKANQNLHILRDIGLKKLTIGQSVIWDGYSRDEDLCSLAVELKMLKSALNEKQDEFAVIEKMNKGQVAEVGKLQNVLSNESSLREDLEKKVYILEGQNVFLKQENSEQRMQMKKMEESQDSKAQATVGDSDSDDSVEGLYLSSEVRASVQHLSAIDVVRFLEAYSLEKYSSLFAERKYDAKTLIKICEVEEDLAQVMANKEDQEQILKNLPKFLETEGKGIHWGSDGIRMTACTTGQCKSVMAFFKDNKGMRQISMIKFESSSTTEVFTSLSEISVLVLWVDHSSLDVLPLAITLETSSTIMHLTLWSCDLTTNAVQLITAALKRNSTLRTLDLDGNDLSDVGVNYICEMLLKNNSLTKFQLSDCDISDIAVYNLFTTLPDNESLQSLMLHRNMRITKSSANVISNYLALNLSLKRLFLHTTSIGVDGCVKLIESLHSNQKLSILSIPMNCYKEIKNLSQYAAIQDRLSFE